ncbi:MAG: hypothetical protein R6T78_04635 [Dehalococcoidales bacterium]
MVWLKFAASIAIILFAGTKLARYGDAISEKTGLGRIWIGLLLLSAITSMPELITGVSSASLVKLPDMAMGTLLGSCLFNLMILAILDMVYKPAPILGQVSTGHIVSAATAVFIAAVVAGGINLGERFPQLAFGWVNLFGILPMVIYLAGLYWVFRRERNRHNEPLLPEPFQYQKLPTRTVYLRFALSAAAVIGAGIWLSYIGEEIALTYNLQTSFVGTLFLAITTSMPELAVTLAVLRLGALDMAVANILGSNMFNLALITPVDIAYRRGPALAAISPSQMVTVLLVILMSLLVIIGIRTRPQHRILSRVSWYSIALIALYIFGIYYIFVSGQMAV